MHELCDDLFGRLHAAVQQEWENLFGTLPSVQPFDLVCGQSVTLDVSNAVLVSKRRIAPGPVQDTRS
jgi:hypothetical protein